MNTTKPKLPAKVNDFGRLRISKITAADIDYVIATVPQLDGFDRSKFIRAAVRYALDSLAEEGFQRDRVAGRNPARH